MAAVFEIEDLRRARREPVVEGMRKVLVERAESVRRMRSAERQAIAELARRMAAGDPAT